MAAATYGYVVLWLLAAATIPALVMGWTPTAVVTGSMSPQVPAGAVVLMEPAPIGRTIEPGRIVVFADAAHPGRRVTHRVVAVNPDGTYQTKGDANGSPDSTPLDAARVQGVARAVVPAVGLPVVWVRDGKFGLLGLWGVASVIALLSWGAERRARGLQEPRPLRRAVRGPAIGSDVLPRKRTRGPRHVRRRPPVVRRVSAVTAAAAVLMSGSGAALSAFSDQTWSDSTLAAAARFTPGFVKSIGQAVTCTGGSSVITVPAGGVAAGNTVIVRVALREQSAASAIGVSDSAGNSWTIDRELTGGRMRVAVVSAHVSTALAAGSSITVTHPSASTTAVTAVEFAGLAVTNRVATTGAAFGNNAAPLATVTTTSPQTLLYGAVGSHNDTSTTEAADWTSHLHQNVLCGGSHSDSHGAFRTGPATGSYTYAPTLSGNAEWVNVVVAYNLDDRLAPLAPTLSGFEGDGEANLSWTAQTDRWQPITYQLFRDGAQVYSGTSTSFIDTGLVNGTSYSYVVRASDGGGNQSGSSNAVTVVPVGGASIKFVKTVGQSTCGTTSSSVTVPAGGVAVGSTLVARLVLRGATISGGVSATDGAGNAYVVDADASRKTDIRTAVLSSAVTTALAAGQTITVTHPVATSSSLQVTEFSGLLAAARVDVTAIGYDSTATPTVSATTATQRALVYGAAGNRDHKAHTAPAGWTALPVQVASCGSNTESSSGYRITTSTGTHTYNPSLSGAVEWAAGLVAYRSVRDDSPPAAPVLSGTAGDTRTSLSWNAVTDPSSPVSYRVTRDGALVHSGTGTTFEDTSLTNGVVYRYRVAAVDAAGNVSPTSNELALTATPLRYVQDLGHLTCGVGSTTLPVPAAGVAAGNTVIIRVAVREGVPETGGVSATDSAGNAYTVDSDAVRPGRVRALLLSAHVAQPLVQGQFITVTHPTGLASVVAAFEVAGVAKVNRVDAVGAGSDNSALPSASATTASTLALVVGSVTTRGNRTHAAPSGWSALGGLKPTCGSAVVDNNAGYRIVSTAGSQTYNPTLVEGGDEWAAGVVAYRAAVDLTAPAAPTLSGVGGYTQTTLTWNAVSDPSTPVTYALSRDGVVVYTGTETTFTDTGLANGTTYSYVVRATDGAGNTSAESNTAQVAPSPIRLLQSVGTATCGGGTSTVSVPAAGVRAGSTLLVRVVVREGSDTGAISATDAAGHVYTLDASAVKAGKVRTAVLSAYATHGLAAGAAITVTHPDGKAEAVLVDEFEGIASENRVDVAGVAGGNTATPVATVATTTDRVLLYGAVGTWAGKTYTSASAWTDLAGTNVALVGCTGTADSRGGYRLTPSIGSYSFNPTLSGGEEWAAALVAYRSSVDVTAPAVPVPSGTPGDTQNQLTWPAVQDPTVPVTYQLFRGATKVYDGTATSFVDTGLENGLTYRYTVRATDGAGNASALSAELELVPTPIAFVRSLAQKTCAGTSSTLTVPTGGVPVGNRVILRVVVREGDDAGAVSATDTAGNTYTVDANAVRAGRVRTLILSAHMVTPLAEGQAITVTHPSGKAQIVDALEFTGIAATNPVQTFGVGSNNTATPSASLTTATRSTLVIGVLGTRAGATTTTRAAWTALPYRTIVCTDPIDTSAAYRLLSTARSVTYDPVLSTGDEWAAAVVAYLPR